MNPPHSRLTALLSELKRRSVFKVGGIYALVAYTVMQVANNFFPPLHLPDWSTTLVAVLAVLGFPIALAAAWVYELTAAGIRRTDTPGEVPGEPEAEPVISTGRLARYGTAGMVVLFLGAGGYLALGRIDQARADDLNSIAVLPFTNMSADPENEYFSDGITEDILTQLSKIGDLRVISRTSVMQYKRTTKGVREIGEELDVAVILEGSVRRAGDQVRITAQLVDARTDEHLWADTYDREIRDLFAVQSEIAQQIAAALQAELTGSEKLRIEAKPTENLAAYDFYLQGRDYYHRYLREDNETAIRLFQRAIELDSSFALAYAGLGDAYGQRVHRFGFPPEWADSALAASETAVSLDPNLAQAYKALALAHGQAGRIEQEIDALRKAVALNPSYEHAVANLGYASEEIGRLDEAVRWFRKARALNPAGSANTLLNLAAVYSMGFEDQDRADDYLDQALALQPDIPLGSVMYAYSAFLRGDTAGALQRSEAAVVENPDDIMALMIAGDIQLYSGNAERAKAHLARAHAIAPQASVVTATHPVRVLYAYSLWATGERQAAERMFDEYIDFANDRKEWGDTSAQTRYDLAAIHAVRGNRADALELIRQSAPALVGSNAMLRRDPMLHNLRSDPEFQRILADMKAELDRQRAVIDREESQA